MMESVLARRKPDVDSNCLNFQQRKIFNVATAYTSPLMDAWITSLINLLALPQYSLVTVFVVSVVSATLVPLGSEPVVLALVEINPAQFWPVVIVALCAMCQVWRVL